MNARFLIAVVIAALSTGCVHAKQTRSEEQKGKKTAEEKKAERPRTETMETSKTTAAMFKPGGIKKLQQALDEAVRDIDQDKLTQNDKSKNPPLGAEGKVKKNKAAPKNEKEVVAAKDEAHKRAVEKKIDFVNATGRFDERTQLALMLYQKSEGLPETGLPDYETLRRLGLKPEEVLYHQVPAQRLGVP
jgi:hypothetical protein